MDSLIFLPDSVKTAVELQESVSVHPDSNVQEPKEDKSAKEPEVEVQVENVERPVDLFKAIFSDDSEDEEEATNIKRPEDQEKTNQAAATTLNRLMAGDFLESLGKELGLEVPPDVVYPETKPLMKEGFKAKPVEGDKSSEGKLEEGSSQKWPDNKPPLEGTTREKEKEEKKNDLESGLKYSSLEDEKSWKKREKLHDFSQQSESSEAEQRGKRSKRRKHRSSDSDNDSSNDYRDKYRARSKEKRKESSREKSRRRKKHSKHHRSKKSSALRYSTDTEEEGEESRKEKRTRKRE